MRGADRPSGLRAPNLMFPVSRRELTPVRNVLSGCRGVTGLVPQPLCMKFKSAEADWNNYFVAQRWCRCKYRY